MKRYEDLGFQKDQHDYTEPQHFYLEPIGDEQKPTKPGLGIISETNFKTAKDKTTGKINKASVKCAAIFCIILLVSTNTITFLATYLTMEEQSIKQQKQENNTKLTMATSNPYLLICTNDSGSIDSADTSDIYKYYTLLNHINISASGTLQFGVKACHDAFIFLSESTDLMSGECYEIVIGNDCQGGAAIRQKATILQQTYLPELLTCVQYRYFQLSWSQYGVVQVMTACNSLPEPTVIINSTKGYPFPVRGIGIRTGFGISGEWKIDLKLNNTDEALCQ